MIKSDKAVSEILGMIMVLFIITLVIGTIMLIGVPIIESGKNRAKMDLAANSFLSLQNDIEEVVRGPIWVRNPKDINITNIKLLGPSRETEFELMGGTLSAFSNNTSTSCTNCSRIGMTNFTITIFSGNITYQTDTDTIAYENGAVIRKYESGSPLMTSYPLINIYDTGNNITVISMHIVRLNGTSSSAGGSGKAWVDIRPKNYSRVIEPASSPNSNQTNIIIFSSYADVWRTFFSDTLNGTGLVPSNGSVPGYNISGTYPLNIQIYGKNKDRTISDIFLSVYESVLDIKVR